MGFFPFNEYNLLFFWENDIALQQSTSPIEMQIMEKFESCAIVPAVMKLRHQELVNKFKGIAYLHSQLADLGEDMRNTMSMAADFLQTFEEKPAAGPLYGLDVERKTMQYLLNQNSISQFSIQYTTYLSRKASDPPALAYFFLSEWDSHQLFISLDYNNQLVVIEKVIQQILLETFQSMPVGAVLALTKPHEYSVKEWEKALLNYLRSRGAFVEEFTDNEIKYHLNLSMLLTGQKTVKHLFSILNEFQPFESINLSHNTVDSDILKVLMPWIRTAKKVDQTNLFVLK